MSIEQLPSAARASRSERVFRFARMIATCDVAPLFYALSLRINRLEFRPMNSVSAADGNWHSASGGPDLSKVLRELNPPAGSVALDLGVGMGIAALTLSRHFARVIGCDLSPELIEIARRNVGRMKATNIELYCQDARQFGGELLDEVTHIYMFNPFPGHVMAPVIENVRQSLARRPRKLTIIYRLPACDEVISGAGFSRVREFEFQNSHTIRVYLGDGPRGCAT